MSRIKDKQLTEISPVKIKQNSTNRFLTDEMIGKLLEVYDNAQRIGDKDNPEGYPGLDADGNVIAPLKMNQQTKLNVYAPKNYSIPIRETVDFMFPDINVLKMVYSNAAIIYSCGFSNSDRTSFIADEYVTFNEVLRLARSVNRFSIGSYALSDMFVSEFLIDQEILSYVYEEYSPVFNFATTKVLIQKASGDYLTCKDFQANAIVINMSSDSVGGFVTSSSGTANQRQAYKPYQQDLKDRESRTFLSNSVASVVQPVWHQTIFDKSYYLEEFEMTSGGYYDNARMPNNFKVQVTETNINPIWEDSILVPSVTYTGVYQSIRWKFANTTKLYRGVRILIYGNSANSAINIPQLQIYGSDTLTYDYYRNLSIGTLTKQSFNDEGIRSTRSLINALNYEVGSGVKIIAMSDQTISQINIPAIPKPRMVLASGDIDLANTINITGVNLLVPTEPEKLRLVVSINQGSTWLTWSGGLFIPINITNLSLVETSGIKITDLPLIPESGWQTLGNGTVRFGYYIKDDTEVDDIRLLVKQEGRWTKGVPGEDYEYSYVSNTELQVTILKNGDYKINYHN